MVKVLKSLLFIRIFCLPFFGECQNIDSIFPFDNEINSFGGILRKSANIEGQEIIKLNAGDIVSVLGMEKYPYFKIKFQNNIGFVSCNSFKNNESFEKVKAELEKIRINEKRKKIEVRKKNSLTKNLIGEKAPNFKLKNLNNKEFGLSDYSEKIILLEFWGAGCGPCIHVAKELKKANKYFVENNISLIIIEQGTLNSVNQIKTLIEKHNINKETLINGKEIAEAYGVKGVPSFFLIDNNGIIVFSHVGSDLLESPVKEDLFKLIQQP